jgi:hypothetical protein
MNGTLRTGAVRLRDSLAASVVPLAMLTAVTGLDLATGRDTVFFPFLILCPALAAVNGSPRSVLVFGMLVLPLRYALAAYDNQVSSVRAEYFQTNTGVFIAATVLCAWVARIRIRRERTLAEVTSVAMAAQEALLPPLPDRVGSIRVGMRYFGAAAEARIGGDLYAAVETPYGTRVLIGDVSGHGLGAVRTPPPCSWRSGSTNWPCCTGGMCHRSGRRPRGPGNSTPPNRDCRWASASWP